MRRSAAPSSLPSNKRRCFQTPFVSSTANSQGLKPNLTGEVSTSTPNGDDTPSSSHQKLKELLKSIRRVPSNEENGDLPSPSGSSEVQAATPAAQSEVRQQPRAFPSTVATTTIKYEPPLHGTCSEGNSGDVGVSSVLKDRGRCDGGRGVVEEVREQYRYYSVMWCKRSTKKHKVWEGDAILVVQDRKVVLKDMDGKDIGRGIGYKKSELCDLSDGSTLIVGGKEVEIMGVVKERDYHSGKCFTGAGEDASSRTTPDLSNESGLRTSVPPRKPKPFRRIKSGPQQTTYRSSVEVGVSPLFNPQAPGALVMPRPRQKHQLEYNVKGIELVDVVVDPHLSSHLRPHQRRGVAFLYQCVLGMKDYAGKGAILADEMGLGKTLQCVALIWTLLKQGPYGLRPVVKKVVVVTPGSLVKNWEQEFRKWLGRERLKVFSVSGENKVEDFINSPLYPVMIISYEMFVRSHETLSRTNFDLVICDEGHRLKNSGTKTTMVIGSLPTRRRILLTGTPIQNDLQEFFSLVDLCNPGVLGSHAAFQRLYESPIAAARQPGASMEEKELGSERAEELKRLTLLFCLRRTQEVINQYLPPKVESIVFCQMSSLQTSIYKHLLDSALVKSCLRSRTWTKGAESGPSHYQTPPHLVCITALKKLCNDPALVYMAARKKEEGRPVGENSEESTMTELFYSEVLGLFPRGYSPKETGVAHSGKLQVLQGMLHQLFTSTNEKIVVVSNYTQTLDLLSELCGSHGYKVLRLDGSTPSHRRQSLVDQFNSKHSRERIFLLSTKAGGVGLNLVGASRLVLYDIDWNPANDLQAMARVWRDGQKRQVHIYRLLTTGSIEEKIFQRQVTKQGLNTVMDFHESEPPGFGLGMPSECPCPMKKKWEVSFSQEELKNLFSLREDTLCDTHDLLGCGCGSRDNDRGETETENSAQMGQRCADEAMDELMHWSHHAHPLDKEAVQDSLLATGNATSNITFLMQHTSNSE